MKINEVVSKAFSTKLFKARIKLDQGSYKQLVDTTVVAKNLQMAIKLLKAQYGKDSVVGNPKVIQDLTEAECQHGRYYCSTDKKWKCRQGPKQTRSVDEEKQRLDAKCWTGYKKQGTKMKGGVRVNNCVPVSEAVYDVINEHIAQGVPFRESIFRPGSTAFAEFYTIVKEMHSRGTLNVDWEDAELLTTDIGETVEIDGEMVPLDIPFLQEEIVEAEYQGKTVKLNSPKRGGSKKFYVYVKDPKTKNVKKVSWGDTTGLSVKAKNPGAVKSFVARHKCKQKNDKTKAGYWACRTPRYKSLGVKGGAWW